MRLLRFAFSALLAMTQRACNDTGANYSSHLPTQPRFLHCHCDPDLSGEAISVRGWEEA